MSHDHIDFLSNQFSHETGKLRSVLMTSILDFDVLSVYIAQIAKPMAERLDAAGRPALRCQKADSRNFARTLGSGYERWVKNRGKKEGKKFYSWVFPRINFLVTSPLAITITG